MPENVKMDQANSTTVAFVGVVRHRELGKLPRLFFLAFICLSVVVAVNYIFGLGIGGIRMMSWAYYFVLIGLLLPFVFLLFPMRKGKMDKIPWYDFVAAFLVCVICIYFSFHAEEMIRTGWSIRPTTFNFSLGLILAILTLEGARRTGGIFFVVVTFACCIYPLFSGLLPGILKGVPFPPVPLIGGHVFGSEGLMGIPMRVIGEIMIGFLVFAGLLIKTGAGNFFLNLALSVAGRFRGGPAKVAIIGSALFGSLSGSVSSNVVATGSITIPAMIKTGYPPHYAGAVEACASTGGTLMPPVMGAAAFVMAAMTDIPYATIIVAAVIPSILYYWGLLLQVDAYAARVGIKGRPREELPSFWHVLKQGWHFLFVFLFLIWGLVYMKWAAMTPFYASGLLILLSMVRKETRPTGKRIVSMVDGVGRLLVEVVGIILPLGLIVSGLVIGGLAPAFTASIVALAGGIPFVVLLLGAVACYILGLVGMTTAAYVFLAVTLAPSLILLGFNVLATHLFIIYYAMLASITPPVALAAFIASGIAGASPMKTAWRAMSLGMVIYFIPFFFIFEPSLVLQGALIDTLWYFATCALGILFMAAGFEGYLLRVGEVGVAVRPLLIIAGGLVAFPDWRAKALGACLAIPLVAFLLLRKRELKKSTVGKEGGVSSMD